MSESPAIKELREKLVALEVAEVRAFDPAAKFKIQKDIEEAKAKLKELCQGHYGTIIKYTPEEPVGREAETLRRRWLWAGPVAVTAALVLLGWSLLRQKAPARRLDGARETQPLVRQERDETGDASIAAKNATPPGIQTAHETEGLLSKDPGLEFTGPGYPVAAAFSSDGRRLLALFTGSSGNMGRRPAVRVWDLQSRQQVTECVLSNYSVERAGDFTPDRQRVLVGYAFPGGGRGVGVIDIPTCTKVQQFDSIWARTVKISSDGKDAFLEGRKEKMGPFDQIEVWDLELGKLRHRREVTRLRAWHSSLAVDPRGRWVAFLGGDKDSGRRNAEPSGISAWDIKLGRELWHVDEGVSATSRGLGVSPDGRVLFVGRKDTVDMLRMPEGELTGTLDCPQGDMYAIAVSPDARLVLAGGTGLALCLWDLRSRRLLASSKGTQWSSASDVAFSPNGDHFLVVSVAQGVYVFPTLK